MYYDAPLFHNLVNSREYRVSSAFEVFSGNRLEDDFLENLGLIAQIVEREQHEETREQATGPPTAVEETTTAVKESSQNSLDDSFTKTLKAAKKDGLMSSEVVDFAINN